ncbi:MAG: hypothetical protein U9Q82_10380, partial [Chloroflexota bacterium]|nr:hypothetical protein [Chloroflexota bacterium]
VLAYMPLMLGVIASLLTGTGAVIHRVLVPGVPFLAIAWAGLLRRRDVGWVLLPLVVISLMANDGYYSAWPVSRHVADYTFLENGAQVDLIYGSNTGILPMLLYADVPVYAADVPDYAGAGLSRRTEQLLGIQKAPLESLEWSRAYLLFKDTGVLESEAERTYARELLAKYNGVRIPTSDSEPGESYLWLLRNNN